LPELGLSSLAIASLAFSCAILTRLYASVLIAGAGIGLLIARWGSFGQMFHAALLIVGVPAAVAFVQMGIRLSIYGEFFPLTFYAKADLPISQKLSGGIPYVLQGFVDLPLLSFAVISALVLWMSRNISEQAKLLLTAISVQIAYLIWAGGDHMPAARMLVPLIAPAAILLLAVTSSLTRRFRTTVLGTAVALTVWFAIATPPLLRDDAAFVGEIVGRHINETWPEGLTVALNTAGSTPVFADNDHVFIDMLGLNDPYIAKRQDVPVIAPGQQWAGHSKGDGAYVLSRAPDRIIVGPAEGVDVSDAWFLSGAELRELSEFTDCYQKKVDSIA